MFGVSVGIMDGAGGAAGGDFESIATAVGTGSSNTITFSSIPSTYKHLQIRYLAKSTRTSSTVNGLINLTFNSDTGSNYAYHNVLGDGSTATANGVASQTAIALTSSVVTSSASYPNIIGVGIIDVADYSSSSKNKTVRAFYGTDQNGYGFSVLSSGLWNSTSTVNTISLVSGTFDWTTSTVFSLYGIKGD